MIFKKPKSYKGLDCSEKKSQVRPRTFEGLASYAMKVANGQMPDIYPGEDPDASPLSEEQNIVAEFLEELQAADKVERLTLVREFNNYIDSLSNNTPQQTVREEKREPAEPKESGESETK